MSDNEEKKIFATNLKYYINLSGKMQIDVAKDLGIAIQTLNGWCNGVSIPTMGKVQKLADYFNIGKSDLLDERVDYMTHKMDLSNEEYSLLLEMRNSKSDKSDFYKRMWAYYSRLNPEGKEELLKYAKLISNSDDYKKEV